MNLSAKWELNEKHILKLFNYIIDAKVCDRLRLKNIFNMLHLRNLADSKKLFNDAKLLRDEIDKNLYESLCKQLNDLINSEDYSILEKKITLLKLTPRFELVDFQDNSSLDNLENVLESLLSVILSLLDTDDIEVLPEKHVLKILP